ncbi:MAG: hypothetical protein ACRC1K_04165, partial [Planctomycetia bacterium]
YPLLVMGGICLVLWMAGEWLKRIANRTSDELDRVAEAQFAAQTKLIKVRHRERDLRFLQERIIVPELHLRSCDDAPAAEGGTAAVAAIDGEFHGRAGDAPAKPTGGLSSHPLLESLPEVDARPEELIFLRNLELLYQDYLDGSLFHRNDTKTAMQLLGNVALNNLRQSNLEMQSKSRRRLKNLDVNQAAGAILGGPFVWFNYITRMVSQQTAKLLLDYNRHAIPLDRLASAPRHERERFREWMARRLGLPLQEIELPVPTGDLGDQVLVDPSPRRKNAAPFFETVDFTAVDFLAGDADRESLLATKYGNQLMAMVRRDRENNVRRAFGTYPLHDVPASSRTINLFTLYDSYLARGQVLLLPFRLVGGIFRLAAFGCKALVRAVDDLVKQRVDDFADVDDPFPVALRKIHRMRKPVFMESLWLRAECDVEYLGWTLPGVPAPKSSHTLVEKDLQFIGATRRDRLAAEKLRVEMGARLYWTSQWLELLGLDHHRLPDYLRRRCPHLASRSAEVTRAVVMAAVVDHDDLYTLGTSIVALQRLVPHAAQATSSRAPLPTPLPPSVDRRRSLWRPSSRRRMSTIKQIFNLPGLPEYSDRERQWIVRYMKQYRRVVEGWAVVLGSQGGDDPLATLHARLDEVIRRTDLWSDQMIALRTIQTLTMLDVFRYSEMVWRLGGYEQSTPATLMPTLPPGDPKPETPPASDRSFDGSTKPASASTA